MIRGVDMGSRREHIWVSGNGWGGCVVCMFFLRVALEKIMKKAVCPFKTGIF